MITNDIPNGIMFADDCEDKPAISGWADNTFNEQYIAVTGGTQDFDNPDDRAGIWLSSDYARNGSKSYKLQLKKRTDYPPCCEWVRSEVAWMTGGDLVVENEWKFARISILIAPETNLNAGIKYQIAYDHKESPDEEQTPFWLGIQGGNYVVDGRHVGETVIVEGGPVVKGVWVDWLLERTWGSNGYINLYRNGVLSFSISGDFSDSPNPFTRIQHGIYKWAWQNSGNQGEGPYNPPADDEPIVIYIDEIKFGTPDADIEDFLFVDVDPNPEPPEPMPTGTIRINSGGKKNGDWLEDKYFRGGTPYTVESPLADQYQTERFGDFAYIIPLNKGSYDVKLHFAEVWHDAIGDRVFDVFIDNLGPNRLVLNNFDIFKEAGGKNKPVVKTIRADIKLERGAMVVRFVTVQDQAKISAIEIVPVDSTTPPPDESMYVKSVELRQQNVDGQLRNVSVTTFNDNTEQIITKKTPA